MWKLYNLLRSITVIIFSNVIKKQTVEVLRDNIDKFLEYFKRAFNESTFIPKFHYSCHYPDLILNYGPLIRFSSMRFERKHLYFKKLSHNLINRKNPTVFDL